MRIGSLFPKCFVVVTSIAIALVAVCGSAADVTIKGELENIFAIPSQETGASQLSGITYTGGQQYYVVGDSEAKAYPLTIKVDPVSGQVRSASFGRPISLSKGRDLEGIAYHRQRRTLFVADEAPTSEGPVIREMAIRNGSLLKTIPVSTVYSRFRDNFGLESLAYHHGSRTLWTANEETLKGDGPITSPSQGARIRLQQFNAALEPVGQFVYPVDPLSGTSPFTEFERRGVVDLAALSEGRLLVLERELGGKIPTFRYSIYLAEIAQATDVSDIARLKHSKGWNKTQKSLLWEKMVGVHHNFEGMTIGKSLGSGRYTLMLVSDNGGGLRQAIWSLVLSGGPDSTPHDFNEK